MDFSHGSGRELTRKDGTRETRRRGFFPRAFLLALLVIAIVFVVRTLAPQTIGEQVRRSVLQQLSQHYDRFGVSIRRGHYDPQIGILFDDVRVTDSKSLESYFNARDMIRIERMIVVADIRPEKLLDKSNPVATSRIILEGVTADAWIESDGRVSLAALWPPPKFGPVCPRIELRRVKLRLLDRQRSQRPVEVDIAELALDTTTGRDGQVLQRVALSGSSEGFRALAIKAEILGDAFQVQGKVSGAHFSRDLFDRLPQSLTQSLQDARDLDLVGDAEFVAARSDGASPVEYQVRSKIHEGRFSHPKLPLPLSQMSGVIAIDPRGIEIESSQAMLGDAVCRVKGRIEGHGWPAAMNLGISASGLWLDERLVGALPPHVRDAWDRLRPVGRVDVDAQVAYSNDQWTSNASVLCNGVDVSFEGFPYPAQQLVGRIDVADGFAKSDAMIGRVGGQRLQCNFRVPLDPRRHREKSFSATVDGPVVIDSSLLSSLSPRGTDDSPVENFVRSLQPRGSIQLLHARLETDASGRPHQDIDLRVVNGQIRYEKFSYPLYNVTGQVNIKDGLVSLSNFRGTNANAGEVLCDGVYRLPPRQPAIVESVYRVGNQPSTTDANHLPVLPPEPRMILNFNATNVPMDESLRSSLPVASRQSWDALMPGGLLDRLDVVLTLPGDGGPLGLDVTAIQNPTDQVTNRSLSLRPASIPYRLDIAGGTVRYDGSRVTIESLEGRHDFSRLSADGVCEQDASGQWLLELDVHSGSRLNPDAELIASLPQQMSDSLRRLQLRGPVSVRGHTKLRLPTERRPEPAIDWRLVFQLEGNRIGDVGPVHSLRGEVWIDGRRDENGLFAAGNVRIDSMHVEKLQITGIRGPYAIDGDRLRMGTLATMRLPSKAAYFPTLATRANSLDSSSLDASDEPQQPDSESIRGSLFGGQIEMDGEVILSTSDFDVSVSLADAQVPTVLAELGQGSSGLTGTFSGQGRFDGKLGAGDLLKGNGAGRLTGANVYQLPFIVQLMNQLRITPTEDVAFTDGEVEFAMFGEMITLNRLQLWGDLVALDGGGTLNRRHELDLSFNTRVSPQNAFNRLLQPLRPERYTLWTIDVTGPMNSPTIERRALDGVGQTLGRLFPSASTAETSPSSGPKSWFK